MFSLSKNFYLEKKNIPPPKHLLNMNKTINETVKLSKNHSIENFHGADKKYFLFL